MTNAPPLRTADSGLRPPGEAADLRLLLSVIVVVILTWVVLLGWLPGVLMSGQDAIAMWLGLLEEMRPTATDPDAVLTLRWLGGAKLQAIYGFPALFKLVLVLGGSAATVINVTTLFVQVALAFTTLKAADALAPTDGRRHLASVVVLTWLSAFAPLLGWRIGVGHMNLSLAAGAFVAVVALAACARQGHATLTLTIVVVVVTWQALQTHGQQVLLYGLTFGAPLVLAVLVVPGERGSAVMALAVTGLALLAALALAAPDLLEMARHAVSSDAGRSLDGPLLTYSHVTLTTRDLLGSWAWSPHALAPPDRAANLLHETHVALGPPLVLALLFLVRRSTAALALVVVSLLAAAMFATRVEPIAQAMMDVVTLLRAFRAPGRVFLPLGLALGVLALATLPSPRPTSRRDWLIGGAAALVPWVLPPLLREILVLGAVGLVGYALLAHRASGMASTLLAVTFLLGGSSLVAFRETLSPLAPIDQVLDQPRVVGTQIAQLEPALTRPLARARMTGPFKALGPNAVVMHGLGSVEGYGHATRRFAQLHAALVDRPFSEGNVLFDLDQMPRGSGVLEQLFNVGHIVGVTEDGRIGTATRPTAGPAWFSRSLRGVDTVGAVAKTLLERETDLGPWLKETVIVDGSDLLAQGLAETEIDATACQNAAIVGVSATRSSAIVDVRAPSRGWCPLVLSMNYLETLHATATTDQGSTRTLRTFPAYGTLQAVVVDPGVVRVDVRARARPLALVDGAPGVGLLLLGLALWAVRRSGAPHGSRGTDR